MALSGERDLRFNMSFRRSYVPCTGGIVKTETSMKPHMQDQPVEQIYCPKRDALALLLTSVASIPM